MNRSRSCSWVPSADSAGGTRTLDSRVGPRAEPSEEAGVGVQSETEAAGELVDPVGDHGVRGRDLPVAHRALQGFAEIDGRPASLALQSDQGFGAALGRVGGRQANAAARATGAGDRPVDDVVIESITISES